MAKMGKYCKAYLLKQFRQYERWQEKTENAAKETTKVNESETEVPRELTDDSVLYLQENYVVTDGIFLDENIIFDLVSPEWQKFCHQNLNFKIPDYSSTKTITINS